MASTKEINNVIRIPSSRVKPGSGNSGVPVPAVVPKPEAIKPVKPVLRVPRISVRAYNVLRHYYTIILIGG